MSFQAAPFRTVMVKSRLSDGSEAFAVHLHTPDGDVIKFDCVTKKDAHEFASKIDDAILEHTCELVGVQGEVSR